MEEEEHGRDPRSWGQYYWFVWHTDAGNYPTRPTPENVAETRAFVKLFLSRLPCPNCRREAALLYATNPLLDSDLESPDAYSRYVWAFHDAVNARLEKRRRPDYEQVRKWFDVPLPPKQGAAGTVKRSPVVETPQPAPAIAALSPSAIQKAIPARPQGIIAPVEQPLTNIPLAVAKQMAPVGRSSSRPIKALVVYAPQVPVVSRTVKHQQQSVAGPISKINANQVSSATQKEPSKAIVVATIRNSSNPSASLGTHTPQRPNSNLGVRQASGQTGKTPSLQQPISSQSQPIPNSKGPGPAAQESIRRALISLSQAKPAVDLKIPNQASLVATKSAAHTVETRNQVSARERAGTPSALTLQNNTISLRANVRRAVQPNIQNSSSHTSLFGTRNQTRK